MYFGYFIASVIIFLAGFICGKYWVTKLEGKTVPLKTVCVIFFVIVLLIFSIVTIMVNQSSVPSSSNTKVTNNMLP